MTSGYLNGGFRATVVVSKKSTAATTMFGCLKAGKVAKMRARQSSPDYPTKSKADASLRLDAKAPNGTV